jgi:DNA-binding MarR family transcriptional regulator
MLRNDKKLSGRSALMRQSLQGMKRVMQRFRVLLDERLRPMGMTTAQLQILFAVRNSAGISGAQLARECFVTPQSVQTLLTQLEKDGLIVRRKAESNDRILTATITASGEKLAKKVEKLAQEIQESLWSGINDRELTQMTQILDSCIRNLEEIS